MTLVPAAAAQAQQTITVANLNDSGTGSLRDAITTAVGDHTTPSTLDTITFASQLSGSINLLTRLPVITDSIDIQGPGARVITLDASHVSGTVIYDQGQGSPALTISGLAMNHGFAFGNGGFLDASSSTVVTLTGDSFSHDGAYYSGGAVADFGGQLTVTGSTFSDDVARHGDGGAIDTNAPFTMSDSTIYANSAYSSGGGLRLDASATISGSTIDDNSVTAQPYYGVGGGGGGIETFSALALQDSIVAGNTSTVPAYDDISDGSSGGFSASFSLIQTVPSNLTVDSSDVTGVSADLGLLTDNGGQTDTQLPASASPVIDQGKAFGLSSDQRGLARTVSYPGKTAPAGGNHTDIGAVELQQPPAVSGVSPATGAPGDTVQITGSGFTGATAVKFAGTPATGFTVTDDGHITATVPAGSGAEDVRVTTPNGQSAVSSGDQFSYLPAVSGVLPASGASGTSVRITGSGFTGATAVRFAGTPATSFTVVDDGHITATVPTGSGVANVRVSTPDGQSAVVTGDQFTYLQQSTTSTTATSTTSTTTPTPTTTTSTTATSTTSTTSTPTATTPTTTAPTTPTPPVQPRITGVSASATTIEWCQGAGCRYPTTRLQFSLNRATTVRLVLRTRPHGHYKQIATTLLHSHPGINHDRIAGRWHGHLVPARPVQILVQIQHHHHWTTTKTIQLTVRHTLRQG